MVMRDREIETLEPVVDSTSEAGFDDRRRDARRPFTTAGRYLLANGQEFPCHTVEVSTISIALAGPMAGKEGSHVIAYLGKLGRVEGFIQRATPVMFVIELTGDEVWRRKFARRLEDLVRAPPKVADMSWMDGEFGLIDPEPFNAPLRTQATDDEDDD